MKTCCITEKEAGIADPDHVLIDPDIADAARSDGDRDGVPQRRYEQHRLAAAASKASIAMRAMRAITLHALRQHDDARADRSAAIKFDHIFIDHANAA